VSQTATAEPPVGSEVAAASSGDAPSPVVSGSAPVDVSEPEQSPNAASANKRFAVKGPADLPDPHLARLAALRDAQEFGMMGLLSSGALGTASGSQSALSARGNMWGGGSAAAMRLVASASRGSEKATAAAVVPKALASATSARSALALAPAQGKASALEADG